MQAIDLLPIAVVNVSIQEAFPCNYDASRRRVPMLKPGDVVLLKALRVVKDEHGIQGFAWAEYHSDQLLRQSLSMVNARQ